MNVIFSNFYGSFGYVVRSHFVRKWVGNQKVVKKRFGQHLLGRKCQLRLGRWSKKDENLWTTPYGLLSSLQLHFIVYQGRHEEFEPDKALLIFYPNFFWLFLIRAYWNPKSRQGPGLGGLAIRGGLVYHSVLE